MPGEVRGVGARLDDVPEVDGVDSRRVAAGGLIVVTNVRTIMLANGIKDESLLVTLGGLLAVWVVLVAVTVRKERAVRRAEREAEAGNPAVEPAAA